MAHLIAELHRHAGHADILREQIDGAAGMLPTADNLPAVDAGWWPSYVERLEAAARTPGRVMTTPSPPRATQPGRCGVLVTTDGPLLAAPKGPAPSADLSDARLTSSS